MFFPAFSSCANDPYCAARTVQAYMARFGQVIIEIIMYLMKSVFARPREKKNYPKLLLRSPGYALIIVCFNICLIYYLSFTTLKVNEYIKNNIVYFLIELQPFLKNLVSSA